MTFSDYGTKGFAEKSKEIFKKVCHTLKTSFIHTQQVPFKSENLIKIKEDYDISPTIP